MRSSQRVVKKRLADGTVKTYTYARKPPSARFDADSLGALIRAYKASPEWLRLSAATHATYSTYLRVLEADPNSRVRDITRRDILALRDAIATTRGHGAATGFLRAAGALFAWAVDREWIEHSPVHRIKKLPGGTLPAWSAAQIAHALPRLSEPLRRALVLAQHTGQRRGDLVALRWNDWNGTTLRFRQQKTGAEMSLPVAPALRAEMEAWRQEARSLTILHDGTGTPWHPARLTERMARALAKIGLSGLGLHGLRKALAAGLADRGATTHEIAAVTGHRTLGMVAHYTRTADQERLAGTAISRLSKRFPKSGNQPSKPLKTG